MAASPGRRHRRLVAGVTVAAALAGCAGGAGSRPDGAIAWEPVGPGAERTLEAYHWRLESAIDGSDRPIEALALPDARGFRFDFPASGVVIAGGCNTMRGSIEVAGAGTISVGRLASTMKACETGLMRADAALAALVAGPLGAAIDSRAEPRLRLTTAANDRLVLVGQPTHETRYGPATVMFLEVAAQGVPCSAPPMRGATCLRVRDRFFDAKGLPAGAPGEWRLLHGEIEGYAHREGERNVIRVKRYHRHPAPADASAFVYVLDLVVESEVVKP